MTYEEKLQKVVSKLKDERDLTRKGHETKAIINDASFTKVRIGDACKILLKLKDDEKILTILRAYRLEGDIASHEDPRSINCDNIDEVEVALGEAFDGWYESYLMRQKTDLKHIDYINLLRIYDVVLDINEQVQLTSKTTVYINLLPPLIRFQILFPTDTPGLRNQYCDNRIRSLKYLKEKGAIVSFDNNKSGWDTRVNVSLILSKFDHFFETIKNEYINRSQINERSDKPNNPSTGVEQRNVTDKVGYDPKKGELNIEKKKVKFMKDSFRAKLLELMLKNEKTSKKEWSWDEILEEIEGIRDDKELKENKDKVYNACDGLTKFVAQKVGINDLLIFNKSTVQINPKYTSTHS